MHKVAIIRGDGIGPEICESTVRVIEASGAKISWEEVLIGQEAKRQLGCELPWASIQKVRRLGVALKAPLIAERCSGGVMVEGDGETRHHPSINNGLRREFGTYANLRPVQGWKGISGRYENLDVVIVREVTEDIYSGIERQVDADCAEATKRITRLASRRIAEFACNYAIGHKRKKVTAIHKANVLHLTDGLFLECARSVVSDYPTLEFGDEMVDASCYHLIKSHGKFDVMVLPNQYGDILSDVVAGLVGSMGLAPGANIGDEVAMFEAAHGAAPDIAGLGLANPIGLVLSGALLLDHLGEKEAAGRVRRGVAAVLSDDQTLTPDLGGRASTMDLTQSICRAMERK